MKQKWPWILITRSIFKCRLLEAAGRHCYPWALSLSRWDTEPLQSAGSYSLSSARVCSTFAKCPWALPTHPSTVMRHVNNVNCCTGASKPHHPLAGASEAPRGDGNELQQERGEPTQATTWLMTQSQCPKTFWFCILVWQLFEAT